MNKKEKSIKIKCEKGESQIIRKKTRNIFDMGENWWGLNNKCESNILKIIKKGKK